MSDESALAPEAGPEVVTDAEQAEGQVQDQTAEAVTDEAKAEDEKKSRAQERREREKAYKQHLREGRDEAEKRVGHLYSKVLVTEARVAERPDLKSYLGEELTVIAWLWARTVKSPNPAFSHVAVPLASTFILSSKAGKEVYVEPVIEGDSYRFAIKVGTPPESAKGGTTAGKRAAFICLMSGSPVDYKHIRSEGSAGRMGQRLMAIVAEGKKGRVYLSPTDEQLSAALQAQPVWAPEVPLHGKCRVNVSNYGLDVYGDLFTPRQLVALTTFSDLVGEAIARCREDALSAGMADDGVGLDVGGTGATAYAQAVGVYLGLASDRMSDSHSTITSWTAQRDTLRNTFARQAIPMVWDYAEANPFSDSTGNFGGALDWVEKAIDALPARPNGIVVQADAQTQTVSVNKVISSDPPYYDNIGYADLSDFFYVWLRRSLRPIFPQGGSTLC